MPIVMNTQQILRSPCLFVNFKAILFILFWSHFEIIFQSFLKKTYVVVASFGEGSIQI